MTMNTDAMILATMLMDSDRLSQREIEDMVRPITYSTLIDELVHNVIARTTFADELGTQWLDSPEEFVARAGWNIQIAYILAGKHDGEIGVRIPGYSERCIDIGERIGKLDNKPVMKGCTSSYAPE